MDSLKILHSTDWHITAKNPTSRTDLYPAACLRKLNELTSIIKEKNPDIVTIGGDLYHTPKISLKFAGLVSKIIRSWGKPVYVVPGSHDMFGRDLDNIDQAMLGFIENNGVINILSRGDNLTFDIGGKTVNIEGQEYYNEIDTGLNNDYRIMFPKDFNILIVHSMLVDKPFVDSVPHTIIKDVQTDADIVLAGHYHPGWPDTKINDTLFINRGSLLRDSIEKRDNVEVTFIEVYKKDGDLTANVEHIPLKCAKPSAEIFNLELHKEKKENEKLITQYRKLIVETGSIKDTNSIYDIVTDIMDKINAEPKIRKLCREILAKAEEKVSNKQNYYDGYIEKPYRVWIEEVELINFRSHEHTIVNFVNGTNVIIGEGSNGKTNILRGILFALYNEPNGEGVVMTGKKETTVRVKLSDGEIVERKRTRKSAGEWNVIKPDGTIISKKGFGANIPIEVINAHQMPKVKFTNDTQEAINVSYQLNGPFLVGDTPSVRAQKIDRLINTEVLTYAIKELNSKTTANNDNIKNYTSLINKEQEELKKYRGIHQLKEKIDILNDLITKAQDKERDLNNVKSLVSEINNKELAITTSQEALTKLEKIDISTQLDRLKSDVVEFNDVCNIVNDIDYYDHIVDEKTATLAELEMVKIINVEKARELVDKLFDSSNDLSKIDDIVKAIDKHNISVQANEKEMLLKVNEIDSAVIDIFNIKAEFKQYLKDNNVCPTCGMVVDDEHLHSFMEGK